MNLQLNADGSAGAAPVCAHLSDQDVPAAELLSVPLSRWRLEREILLARAAHCGQRIGVRLNGDDSVAEIANDLPKLDLIVVEFPRFTDGRGYSMARQLRDRYGYRGELRAAGDVQRDQLYFLARCGFDVLELSPGLDSAEALAALGEISVQYQPASAVAAADEFPLAIAAG